MQPTTKRILLITLASIAGAVLVGALVWYLIFLGQFTGYKDRTYRFAMKYPRAWQKVVAPQPGAAVVFVSPQENALDIFRENVNISLNDLSGEIATLKSYKDRVLLQMSKVFVNMKVVESKPVTFGDRPGYLILFEAKQPDPLRVLVVFTTRGGSQAYVLTYMATIRKYPAYLPLVQEMIRSFKLQ